MITTLRYGKKFTSALESFLLGNDNPELYITTDNKRQQIKNMKLLRRLAKQSLFTLMKEENGSIKGVLCVWKAKGGVVERNYVKVGSDNDKTVKDLLTALNWNFNKEVFVKLSRDSRLVDSFKSKGFRFFHDRGKELLLRRDKNDRIFIVRPKEADLEE